MNPVNQCDIPLRDLTAAEINLKKQHEAMQQAQTQASVSPQRGIGIGLSKIPNVNPCELAAILYQKRQRLISELEEVRGAINLLENDEALQKLIRAYQAAGPINV